MEAPDAQAAPAPPTFDVLPLSSELRKAVDGLGYVHPTPVQRAVFEPAARGRDLVVQARTGTGKTAAFGLPLSDSIVRKHVAAVQAVVLCPTRELALQITRELDALNKFRGLRTVAIYGGAPMPKQVEAIRAGAQILVGTPGRVLDHLARGTLDTGAVRCVVLDESDEMLGMGFLPQIDRILSQLPKHQTLLFSATLPRDVRRMAETRLTDPEFITLSGDHIGALEIEHYVYLSRTDKVDELKQILEIENPEDAIVFCNTKDETKRVANALAQHGYSADWLNADLAQNEREKVMAATRAGELRFLVATDVAARGIDLSHVTHVINFDFPLTAEAYVHRTGRTGRAGRTGTAISLITPSDIGNLYILRLTYKIRPIEKQLPTGQEMRTREQTDLVNMFAELFTQKRPHPEDVALARRLLTHEQADAIVAGLLRDHLGVRPEAQEVATAARRAGRATPPRHGEQLVSEPVGPTRARESRPGAGGEGPRRRSSAVRASVDATKNLAGSSPTGPNPTGPNPTGPNPTPNLASSSLASPDRVQSPREEAAAPAGTPESVPASFAHTDGIAGSIAEIFVNVGRQDGARPGDFERILTGRGLEAGGTAYVRVRNRHSFIGVKREVLERALAALNGALIGSKKAVAEQARARD